MDEYQLHAFVEDYNWDDGPKRLLDVVRHPLCTLATALLVYWKSEPQELSAYQTVKDAPRGDKKLVELLREIEANVKKRHYRRGAIPFDVRDVNGVDLSDDDPAIPDDMRQA